MLKYVIKNIKIDGEVIDLYARAEAEDVIYYIPKETGGYENKSLQTVLSQVEADIKKLKKDIEQIEIGGSTIIQPIEYGGTGADNVVKANQNLSSAFLSSIPWGIESFSVISPDKIDYALPDGTYRFNSGDFPTVTINVQPVDAYSGQALTTTPWTVEVPAYSIVNIVHSDGNAASLSTIPDDISDLGYHSIFLKTVEISNIVENYDVQENMEVYAFVYGDSITIDFPMEKQIGITYSVNWYAETGANSGEYTLTNIKSPNPEIRGGDGFTLNQSVSVTDSDKVLNSDYTFDVDNTKNVTSINLTANESENQLKLYFNKIPDPVYADVHIKVYDGDTGEELTGDFKAKKTTLEGTEVIVTETYPETITGFEPGNFITFTATSSITKEVEDGDDLVYNFDSEDERNITAITIQEDSSQNIIKFYYKLEPSVTTYTIKYVTDLGTPIPTLLLNPNIITKTGNVGDTVSLTVEEATKQVNGFLPSSTSSSIVLVKDTTQNVLNVVYPFAAIERDVTIHYVVKEVEDTELIGEYDRVIYNAENDTISKIDTITLPWERNCVIGDTLPITALAYIFTQDNITLYSIDSSDTDNLTEWTVPVTGDLTLYYEVTTVTNLPETVLMEPEALVMALNMELDTSDNLVASYADYTPEPSRDTGISSSDLLYGKLFVMSQQYNTETNSLLGIHLFVGEIDSGDGTEKAAVLFRCFDKQTYEDVSMSIPWTSLSDSGIDEVTPDIINGIIPIPKGGTGVSDITDIGNALKVLALDYNGKLPLQSNQNIDTYKIPGVYRIMGNSTTTPENEVCTLIVYNCGDESYPEQVCIINYNSLRIYHRAWHTKIVSGVDQSGYSDWQMITLPDKITADRLPMYGVCTTAGNVAAKEVAIEGFKLQTGARISVLFTNASTVNNMTLNVNNTGAYSIRAGTTNFLATTLAWVDQCIVSFTFNGNYWVIEAGVVNAVLTTRDLKVDLTSTNAQGFNGSADATQIGVSGILPVANGGTGNTTGNAVTATKLKTSKTIQTNLASTNAVAFDGTANVTPGVTGTLSVSNGGTGKTTLSEFKNHMYGISYPSGTRMAPSGAIHEGNFNRKWFYLESTNAGVASSRSLLRLTAPANGRLTFQIGISGEQNYDYVVVEHYRGSTNVANKNYKSANSNGDYKEYTVSYVLQTGDTLDIYYRKDGSGDKGNDLGRLFGFIWQNELLNMPRLTEIFNLQNGYNGNYMFRVANIPDYDSVFSIDSYGNMLDQGYGYNELVDMPTNILINPYFIFPVNQRVYPASGANWKNNYFIDRWKYYGTVNPTLNSGVQFTWSGSANNLSWSMEQPFTPAQKAQLLNMRQVTIYAWIQVVSFDVGSGSGLFVAIYNDTKSVNKTFSLKKAKPNSGILLSHSFTVPYDWDTPNSIRFACGCFGGSGNIRIQECGVINKSAPVTLWQTEETYQQELKKCYETYQVHKVDLVGLRFSNEDTRCSVPVHPMRTIPTITWGGDLSFITHTGEYTNYWLVPTSEWVDQGSSVKIVSTKIKTSSSGSTTTVMNSGVYVFGTRNSVLTLNAEL